ncbi:MAG: AAA family ATPase [Bowdeniella nasicola]|nr:AAA family ATPase [Bowdeniella nasicola]
MTNTERTREALLGSVKDTAADAPLARQVERDHGLRAALEGAHYPAPSRTRVMTVSNQKGGVGKTTTTVNVAAALASNGLKVLVIDADPQGNASTALSIDHPQGTPSIYEVLVNDVPLADVIQPCTDIPGLSVVPATIDLSGAEIELVMREDRADRLATALSRHLVDEYWDYVLIDCPPSLGLLTLNAFVAASEVLIPIQTEYYALEGLSQLLSTIERVQQALNPKLRVSTIVLTMNDRRTNLARDVADEVRRYFPNETLRTVVPRSVRVSEAPSHGQTVITYDPHSTGSLAYRAIAKEIADRGMEMPS